MEYSSSLSLFNWRKFAKLGSELDIKRRAYVSSQAERTPGWQTLRRDCVVGVSLSNCKRAHKVCGHSSCTCQNMAACDLALLRRCYVVKVCLHSDFFFFPVREYNCSNYSKIGAVQLEKQHNERIYHMHPLQFSVFVHSLLNKDLQIRTFFFRGVLHLFALPY